MSSVDEKLKIFEMSLLSEATKTRDKIIKDITAQKDFCLGERCKIYEDEASTLYKKSIDDIINEGNVLISKANFDGKNELVLRRNFVIEEVFNDLYNKINSFTNTEEYGEFILRKVNEALLAISNEVNNTVCDCHVEIMLTSKDIIKWGTVVKALAESIIKSAKITLYEDPESIIGGCRIRFKTKGLVVDNSIRTAINSEREQFLQWSGL